MSGFDPDWLALREPVDHAARNPALALKVAGLLAGRDPARIVDLGCGRGSNLRAMAPLLPARQAWRLVDNDPRLLAAAREALAKWADACEAAGDGLVLSKAGKRIEVAFVEADLATDPAGALGAAPDLVTAAALFDLCSEGFTARIVAEVAGRRLPFYTVLTYDGREAWDPPHPADARIHAAFLAHQKTDKGFGPALGPDATAVMARLFAGHGYVTEAAESPWRLGPDTKPLMAMLAEGIAGAAEETGQVDAATARAWLAARRIAASAMVGHLDLLAVPA
jgi:SAM-dependent methyltransferase